jgi:exonuclease III
MLCITLRGLWYDSVLKVHAQIEDISHDMKDSFYEELEHVINQFPKYHMTILLGDFNANIGKEDIFKPKIENESLHEISNDNGLKRSKLCHIATSKRSLIVKSTMFPYCNIHKYTCISPYGKTQSDCLSIGT